MADAVAGRDKCGEPRLVSLPLSRIRVIMKSSPEVSSINQEALVLTTKATELFVQYLATYSYRHGSGKERKALTYSDLSNTAEESETFQFLAGHCIRYIRARSCETFLVDHPCDCDEVSLTSNLYLVFHLDHQHLSPAVPSLARGY
ncbi:chromatin accessibility complex protein 1 isoform X1 [Ailuropoda melanoleuca]|uniref:chromatin accessibility complex protein 1 isoform X1 n=1 Tax=Ailuropoda melanoleuca TaxID=9646 RepID=UPI00149463D4|nr:chromatin accessibility complex protein 1 isoform X1 [Ailuropoda melanoleuca]